MSESVVGRGVIELVADARKLKAGIEDAKKSIRTLGEGQKDISRSASESIDRYIGKLQQHNAILGKSARETELYKLAMRGASNEQINAANSALLFREEQQKTQAVLAGLRAGLIAVGIAAAAAFAAKTANTIEFLDKLNDLHKATGITVEDLAGLSLLAKQTGTDLEGIAKGINKMSVEMGKEPEKFRALGVTATESVEAFKQLADIFNKIPDISLRNALAQKVFSKSWQELAPALSEGSQGISEAIEKGTRLSGITKEMAKQADEFNDRLAELKISSAAFGADFIPTLTKIVNLLVSGKEAAKNFFGLGVPDLSKELERVEAQIDKLKKKGEPTLAQLSPGFSFNTRAIQASTAQIAALEKQRDALKAALDANIPTLGRRGRTAEEAAAEEKAARDATANARKFLDEGASDRARAEAAARLQFDLEQIKKSSEGQISAFKNAEQIMESLRSAALVSDRDYYASKLGFITLIGKAQEQAFQEQISRLQQETFTGKNAAKERIENDRKILDTQAQLAKVRAESATQVTINAIQEEAANQKIRRSLDDARIAAEAYIDTIQRRNARELEGVGRGNRNREFQAGLGDIDERLSARRRQLEGELRRNEITRDVFDTYLSIAEKAYEKEVELYRDRSDAIKAAEQNWLNGAMEALTNYYDETRNLAKLTEDLFTNAFKSMEDALVEFTKTGKLDFKSLINSIITDIARLQVKQNLTGPLAKWLSGFGGGGGGSDYSSGKDWENIISGIAGRAGGGPVTAGSPFLVGEMGPEIFVPRQSGTIVPNGAGGATFNINITGSQQDAQAIAAAVVPLVRSVVRGEMGNSMRPGGALNPA